MPHKIVLVISEGISLFHLSVPGLVFGDRLLKLETPRYEVIYCAENSGEIRTLSNITVNINYDFSVISEADTIIIPAWPSSQDKPSNKLLNLIQNEYANGKRIVALCLGAFVLAESGILDGKHAATHWAWADEFIDRYPNIILDHYALYVEDQNIIISAGTAAAIDCCLYILKKDFGAEIANSVAKRLVIAPHRQGNQSQYVEKNIHKYSENDHFIETMEWAINNLECGLTLEKMAQLSCMSIRNFTRHFKKRIGVTFTQWLLTQKLYAAQRFLENSNKSIETIANESGFSSTISFRQQFVRNFSIPPSVYRKKFKSELK